MSYLLLGNSRCGGADLPDGSASGQLLVWNDVTGAWEPQTLTPGDIGAAAASHTHDYTQVTGYVTDMVSGGGAALVSPIWTQYGGTFATFSVWRYFNQFYLLNGMITGDASLSAVVFRLYTARLQRRIVLTVGASSGTKRLDGIPVGGTRVDFTLIDTSYSGWLSVDGIVIPVEI